MSDEKFTPDSDLEFDLSLSEISHLFDPSSPTVQFVSGGQADQVFISQSNLSHENFSDQYDNNGQNNSLENSEWVSHNSSSTGVNNRRNSTASNASDGMPPNSATPRTSFSSSIGSPPIHADLPNNNNGDNTCVCPNFVSLEPEWPINPVINAMPSTAQQSTFANALPSAQNPNCALERPFDGPNAVPRNSNRRRPRKPRKEDIEYEVVYSENRRLSETCIALEKEIEITLNLLRIRGILK